MAPVLSYYDIKISHVQVKKESSAEVIGDKNTLSRDQANAVQLNVQRNNSHLRQKKTNILQQIAFKTKTPDILLKNEYHNSLKMWQNYAFSYEH